MITEPAGTMSAGVGRKACAEVVHTYPAQSGAIMLAAQAYKREFDRVKDESKGARHFRIFAMEPPMGKRRVRATASNGGTKGEARRSCAGWCC